MQPRARLTARQVEELHEDLSRRLDSIGLRTQPEVAVKLLELNSDPDAGMGEFAGVIKTDPALSGRLLRMANSAFFAQREAVTTIDRACVLIGLERLRAVSLGFHMSRAAATDSGEQLSRRVWGEAVYRACLATEISRVCAPRVGAQAFLVGLMLDAGVPIMHTLLGDEYEALYESAKTPQMLFKLEFESLPFTHVDVAASLAKKWNLPPMLAKPLEWHHTRPGDPAQDSDVYSVHRIAFYVGALVLDGQTGKPEQEAPMPSIAQRLFALPADQLASCVQRAAGEYSTVAELFNEAADAITDLDSLAERVHLQLIDSVDRALIRSVEQDKEHFSRIDLEGRSVEFESDSDGYVTAFLRDHAGERIVSYRFRSGEESTSNILDALGFDKPDEQTLGEIDEHIRRLAA